MHREKLYASGLAPTRSWTYALTLEKAGIPLRHIEQGKTKFASETWAPVWAVVVCASTAKHAFDGSASKPGPLRKKIIAVLKALAMDAAAQDAVMATARMSSVRGVAKLLKLPIERDLAEIARMVPSQWNDDRGEWEPGEPLWWLDPRENNR